MKDISYEDKIAALTANIREQIDTIPKEAKEVVNSLIKLGNLQVLTMDALMSTLGLENHSFEEAKEEIIQWKKKATGLDVSDGIRDKFYERVEFVASETRDVDTEPNKLVMWNARNGDLYMSICPMNHRGGISMRFERSGGCSTKNPELLGALMDAYDAIAGNFKEPNNSKGVQS